MKEINDQFGNLRVMALQSKMAAGHEMYRFLLFPLCTMLYQGTELLEYAADVCRAFGFFFLHPSFLHFALTDVGDEIGHFLVREAAYGAAFSAICAAVLLFFSPIAANTHYRHLNSVIQRLVFHIALTHACQVRRPLAIWDCLQSHGHRSPHHRTAFLPDDSWDSSLSSPPVLSLHV